MITGEMLCQACDEAYGKDWEPRQAEGMLRALQAIPCIDAVIRGEAVVMPLKATVEIMDTFDATLWGGPSYGIPTAEHVYNAILAVSPYARRGDND